MNHILLFEDYEDYEDDMSFTDYPYQMYYVKNGMGSAKGGYSIDQLTNFAEANNLLEFQIFRKGHHSTTQDEYLVLWYDERGGNYFSNIAKKKPELYKKEYKPEKRIARKFNL